MKSSKTKIVVELSDANLLRLRTLLFVENDDDEHVSMSEFLDQYLTKTLDGYIVESINGEHCYVSRQTTRLLESLLTYETINSECGEISNGLPEGTDIGGCYIEGTC